MSWVTAKAFVRARHDTYLHLVLDSGKRFHPIAASRHHIMQRPSTVNACGVWQLTPPNYEVIGRIGDRVIHVHADTTVNPFISRYHGAYAKVLFEDGVRCPAWQRHWKAPWRSRRGGTISPRTSQPHLSTSAFSTASNPVHSDPHLQHPSHTLPASICLDSKLPSLTSRCDCEFVLAVALLTRASSRPSR